MNIRPATREDFEKIDGQPPAKTLRAMTAEEDGRIIGLWGIYPQNTRYVLFSTFSPEFRRHRRNFVHAVKSAKQLIASRPSMPVIAIADPEIEGSDVLLRHMGFEPLNGRIYQWLGLPQLPQ